MGEAIDVEYIVIRKLSKLEEAAATLQNSLGKLEKYISMPGCSGYQTDHDSKVKWWVGWGAENKICIDE